MIDLLTENDTPMGMRDDGKRMTYADGGLREPEEGKGRFDLIEPEMLFRIARWYELGAKKYADRNWEKGISVSRCVSAAFRHLVKYMAGWADEDHLAAVVWNCAAIMRFEKHYKQYREYLDMPWMKEECKCQMKENCTTEKNEIPKSTML